MRVYSVADGGSILCADAGSRLDGHLPGHRRRGVPRLAPVRRAPAPRPSRHLRRQPRDGLARQHRAHPRRRRSSTSTSTSSSRTSSTSRSTSSTTSPRRRRRSTTCACRCTRSRSAPTARTTRSALAKFKRARFLLASTSEVYGDPQVHPQPESYWGHVNPIGPRGVYDEAKRYAEALTMAYHRQQGVDTAIVRIFNTYGPRMRPHDGRAIPTFLRQALAGPADHGLRRRVSQTRSFCYVERPDRGIIALAESGLPPAGQHRQPGRVHAARAGRGRDRGDRLALGDRLRGAADRRPAGAPARHHARARAARLGAGGRPARGPAAHDRARPASRPRRRRQIRRMAAHGSAPARRQRRKRTLLGPPAKSFRALDVPLRRATTERPGPAAAGGAAGVAPSCPTRDVRRKRPPVLSFLLRMETLRRARASSRCWRSTSPASALRSSPRWCSRRCVRGRFTCDARCTADERTRRLRLPAHGAAVRPLGLYADRAPSGRASRDRRSRCSRSRSSR